MVDEPKPGVFPISGDIGRAPIIFFDGAPNIGGFNGLVSITLGALLQTIDVQGNPQLEQHLVAHLRTNIAGAKALRAAIDGALLMVEPVEGQAN